MALIIIVAVILILIAVFKPAIRLERTLFGFEVDFSYKVYNWRNKKDKEDGIQ